ncbi:putative cyclin-D6-1 isoform X2 [Phalaenopsis equestris]|uniref:putative cyclin-D6-1 isoform X2 n=1 Tax=Phalaenopsis equestris TaxID=78828 RepID=UPI0009E1D7C4|nr:putative cyclin-D6-1 isoform X2 [Phalaenopsis equestris]
MEFNFDLENPLSGTDEKALQLSKRLFLGSAHSDEPAMLFAAESEHMCSLAIALNQLSTRSHALSVIVQAQFSNNLDPALAYLAANYIDRFLAKSQIPDDKPWIARLLAISCLCLASKMKNIGFSPADVQREEGFIFDARTIRRMELVVLGALEWRMRSITPFSFLRFFISYFPLTNPIIIQSLKTHASQILFKFQSDVKSLEFKPSVTAAAALLAAARELFPADFPSFRSALLCCEYLNKGGANNRESSCRAQAISTDRDVHKKLSMQAA